MAVIPMRIPIVIIMHLTTLELTAKAATSTISYAVMLRTDFGP